MGNDEKIITPGQWLIRILLIIFRISNFTNRWNEYMKLKIEIGSLFMLFCNRLAFRQADKHNFHIITQWMRLSIFKKISLYSFEWLALFSFYIHNKDSYFNKIHLKHRVYVTEVHHPSNILMRETVRNIAALMRRVRAEIWMIVGTRVSILTDPAMFSCSSDEDSNQNTGNIVSCKSLNRWSIPSTFLSRMFNWSLMFTFTGMEDRGSSQRTELCLSGSGRRPSSNWSR